LIRQGINKTPPDSLVLLFFCFWIKATKTEKFVFKSQMNYELSDDIQTMMVMMQFIYLYNTSQTYVHNIFNVGYLLFQL